MREIRENRRCGKSTKLLDGVSSYLLILNMLMETNIPQGGIKAFFSIFRLKIGSYAGWQHPDAGTESVNSAMSLSSDHDSSVR